jgi:hypothetical protein
MKAADGESLILALRGSLDGDDGERKGRRIAEYVIERALAGHFAFFRLVLDLVDGKNRPTAEEEQTYEVDCVLVVADDKRDAKAARTA